MNNPFSEMMGAVNEVTSNMLDQAQAAQQSQKWSAKEFDSFEDLHQFLKDNKGIRDVSIASYNNKLCMAYCRLEKP